VLAPRHWRIVEAFRLTPSGKIKKYVLRDEMIADLGVGELVSGPDISSAAPLD
jgi:acyl-coenzyme A synthetase/AMP-(fatty) acid ligase